MVFRLCVFVLSLVPIVSCAPPNKTPTPPAVSSTQRPSAAAPDSFGPASSLILSDGAVLGEVRAAQLARGVAFGFVAREMPPGVYRLYIHAVGRCDPPEFRSAGPPWTPPVPIGYGIPDLGLVRVGSDGKIYRTHVAQGVKLRPQDPGNLAALLDSDGATLVIHSPGGEPYAPPATTRRVACAVVR